MRAERKITLSIVAIGFLVVVGYFGFDYYMGTRLVRELCARDGGLKIIETTFAKGYLDETVADPVNCWSCFERLAKRQFEYIDVHVPARTPGYFRLSLSKRGDLRCEPSKETFGMYGWDMLQRNAGIDERQCVAVEALSELPEEPALSEVREKIPNERSVDVRVDHWRIRHTLTGKTLAEYRNYLFYTHWDRIFNFAGGDVPEPATACDGAGAYSKAVLSLSERTLRTSMNQIPKTND